MPDTADSEEGRRAVLLVSHQNAKGTVLSAPCQIAAQKNRALGSLDTLASWRP